MKSVLIEKLSKNYKSLMDLDVYLEELVKDCKTENVENLAPKIYDLACKIDSVYVPFKITNKLSDKAITTIENLIALSFRYYHFGLQLKCKLGKETVSKYRDFFNKIAFLISPLKYLDNDNIKEIKKLTKYYDMLFDNDLCNLNYNKISVLKMFCTIPNLTLKEEVVILDLFNKHFETIIKDDDLQVEFDIFLSRFTNNKYDFERMLNVVSNNEKIWLNLGKYTATLTAIKEMLANTKYSEYVELKTHSIEKLFKVLCAYNDTYYINNLISIFYKNKTRVEDKSNNISDALGSCLVKWSIVRYDKYNQIDISINNIDEQTVDSLYKNKERDYFKTNILLLKMYNEFLEAYNIKVGDVLLLNDYALREQLMLLKRESEKLIIKQTDFINKSDSSIIKYKELLDKTIEKLETVYIPKIINELDFNYGRGNIVSKSILKYNKHREIMLPLRIGVE